MSSSNSIIQSLRKIVGYSNVLTDLEDLYVYSFEQFFKQKQYPGLKTVVRVKTEEQSREVKELAETYALEVAIRSAWKKELNQSKTAIILIDDAHQPELTIIGK